MSTADPIIDEAAKNAQDSTYMTGVMAKKFGISGVIGACTGVAIRRLTSDAMYGAGLCFAGLQGLAYLGYVTIHWNYIGEQFVKVADQNDDGKFDMQDVNIFFKKMVSFLAHGLPDAAGFTSGVIFGMKYLA